ncbi:MULTISPECIES: Lrp/AsnC family transcriptional regulator [Spongiibacter]|uniref:Lrp/AsnC family transcriptional regulator n=1 Tax=Spongiibacter TaxID=630749 RepID=UPI000C567819|nr:MULTISPECIES: Lrp/AsnC family transcriptional regulator [Spongiibacter]MAY39354.1 AsnC family transcriptional regulator [Spongiibacter sp.]MBI58936.1 AsnC family transcriptional regulator [Spongiibacter sp.]|tara:strand:+ start:647 stop:1108 length:462 start_codon:yes stop_codon:yes gene_type:complete
MRNLDRIDRAILAVLQVQGRIANVELAERVGLSESACLRRVKQLDELGVISHYAAHVNAESVGLAGTVFVNVSLADQREESLRGFEAAIQSVPEVMECYLMSGEVDYMLRVVVAGTSDFERIHNQLTRLPGVARVQSSFALRPILKRTSLPLR